MASEATGWALDVQQPPPQPSPSGGGSLRLPPLGEGWDGGAAFEDRQLFLSTPFAAKRIAVQTRFSDIPAVLRSRSIRCGAILDKGSTSLAAPAAIASRGMPKTTQVASSCTML